MRLPRLLLAICIICAVAVPALAAETEITRVIASPSPDPGADMEVVLNTAGLRFGGVVEKLPKGFDFVGTGHPPEQVSVSGNNVVFAVMGEPEIRYTVRAPASGGGTVSGSWEDLETGAKGEIAATQVAVAGSAPPQESPGFKPTFSLAALLLIGLMMLQRRSV